MRRSSWPIVASAEAQTKWNAAVGQLPTNKNSTVDPAADPFLSAGFCFAVLATGGIAQFWDRDAEAEYAKAGMEGFQRFLVQPEALGRDSGAPRSDPPAPLPAVI